jgi:hypothetical protein
MKDTTGLRIWRDVHHIAQFAHDTACVHLFCDRPMLFRPNPMANASEVITPDSAKKTDSDGNVTVNKTLAGFYSTFFQAQIHTAMHGCLHL